MKSHRVDGDPIGSEAPRGKDCSEQRGRYDPGWTGTELRMRNSLLRQFMKNPEGEPPSEAYKNASCWCPGCDGKRLVADTERGLCSSCSWSAWSREQAAKPENNPIPLSSILANNFRGK